MPIPSVAQRWSWRVANLLATHAAFIASDLLKSWLNSKFQREVLLKSWVYLACYWELCPNDTLSHWNKHCRSWFSSKYKLTMQIFPRKLENYFIPFFTEMSLQPLPVYSTCPWITLHDTTLHTCMYVKKFSQESICCGSI